MTKEKVFSLKLGTSGQAALKETVNKHTSDDQTRIKVVFALDSELRIVEPYVFEEGKFLDTSTLASQNGLNLQDFLNECKRENKSIFFALGSLTYICTHTIVLNRGVIVKNTLNLFVPTGVKKNGLVCDDVSMVFPRQNRNTLADNFTSYSLSRI